MQLDKTVNLPQLESEMKAVGINTNGLGTVNDGTELYTYDETGAMVDLPETARAVIDAHVPAPPQPTQDDYLLDLDYRLSMIELGL